MESRKLIGLLVLTGMAIGRAMTLAFIWRAGDGGAGDPPLAWRMPLIGDAIIGISAVVILCLLLTRRTPGVWTAAVVWTVVAAFDALAAFIVETTAPWPDFFMIEIFGRSMFFAAIAMHLVILALLLDAEVRTRFDRVHA